MPTPLEILLDPISLIIIALYIALMTWEGLYPGRKLPQVRFWKLRGLLAFAFYFFLSTYLPLLIDPYLAPFRLFNLSSLGSWGGGLIAILVYEFGTYLWHYSLHKSDFLWRTFHQMHHSAERLDTYGTFYFSPLDMVGWTLLSTFSITVIGVTPQAVTIMLLMTTFFNMFQHSNIKTPRWLGYFIQRPESHTMHHAKGIHRYNYSDLPLFDILFGTFHNPKDFEHETGFYQGASSRIGDMLLFKDVSEPQKEK
jgi:sterol desaturase/sphingolipid hydroxylase (fatty acid hydroxylase superfamily)